MLFAETVIQVDGASLVGGLTALGSGIGGGVVLATKLIINYLKDRDMRCEETEKDVVRVVDEHRADRISMTTTLLEIQKGSLEVSGKLLGKAEAIQTSLDRIERKRGGNTQ